jgi:CRISPR-associated protein Cas1
MPDTYVPRVQHEDWKRPVYVVTQGTFIAKNANHLNVFLKKDRIFSVNLDEVSHLCVFGRVQISSALLHTLCNRGIPVIYMSKKGWFYGICNGVHPGNIELRVAQFEKFKDGRLDIAKTLIASKIKNCRTLLRRNAKTSIETSLDKLNTILSKIDSMKDFNMLRGIEGSAAREYYSVFTNMISIEKREQFNIDLRSKRPPKDKVNALLSYTYVLLTKEMFIAAYTTGFDPYLGFFHTYRNRRPALALDLIEELRPVIADSVVLSLINRGEIRTEHFVESSNSVLLTIEGKRALIDAYERRLEEKITHKILNLRMSYRELFLTQTRLLAAYLNGQIETYIPLEVR